MVVVSSEWWWWLLRVMGGYGYMGEYAVERLWRDAKLLEIGGGTLESHHKNMARARREPAAPRCERRLLTAGVSVNRSAT